MDVQTILFTFFGGLGIFLFGIQSMGDGLQKVAGDSLRDLLDKVTTNPFMGVLAGIVVTVLLQTSSGTTVLTIGLVNAGFMTLKQAIGVIMGANIGTTATAFIIGIKISKYALPILGIGAALIFFFKNKKVNNYGTVLFGFGALFYGLDLMGKGMAPLASLPTFTELTLKLSESPILGVLIGTIFTMVIQSSTAAIGMLQELYDQGAIELYAALSVLIGDNIGTTVTAVLASIGASITARRAGLTHVMFNVIGATIVLILFPFFSQFIAFIGETLSLNPKMEIAFAHGIYNVSNTMIQFPFIGVLAWIVTKLVPGEDVQIEYKPKHLNPSFVTQSPAIALDQAKKEVLRMAEYALNGLKEVGLYLKDGNQRNADLAMSYEEAINNLDRNITEYLILISSRSLSGHDSNIHSMLMDTVRDIERIGDHIENIVELKDFQKANKVEMSNTAMEDLKEMFDLTVNTLKEAIESLTQLDADLARSVQAKEELIDKMERKLRRQHIQRINEGACTGSAGIVFVDIVSNFERIGDHAVNIADAVIREVGYSNK